MFDGYREAEDGCGTDKRALDQSVSHGTSELRLHSLRDPTPSPGKIRAQGGIFLLGIFEKFVEEVVRNPSSTSASIFAGLESQQGPMPCAEWDGTEHQTYSKASNEPNSQSKTIDLGTEINEN